MLYYVLKNVKTVLHLATKTANTRGRPTDDTRSLVQTIILATLPSPTATKKFSTRENASLLGIPKTMYLRAVKAVKAKRAALEGVHTLPKSVYFSQVVKAKQWRKISPQVRQKFHDYIRGHPDIIVSPIKGDTISIPYPADVTKKIKVPERLRTVSIRQLQHDLIKNIPECTSSTTGKALLSDTNLRANMLPEVKKMSDRYKEMCS